MYLKHKFAVRCVMYALSLWSRKSYICRYFIIFILKLSFYATADKIIFRNGIYYGSPGNFGSAESFTVASISSRFCGSLTVASVSTWFFPQSCSQMCFGIPFCISAKGSSNIFFILYERLDGCRLQLSLGQHSIILQNVSKNDRLISIPLKNGLKVHFI